MTREELIEKMLDAYQRLHYSHNRPTDGYNSLAMAAALDVAVGEIQSEAKQEAVICEKWWRGSGSDFITDVFARLQSIKPKSDPAVEAAFQEIRKQRGYPNEQGSECKVIRREAEQIVAAVRAADKGSHALR